jgi:hypothetical protein
MKRRLWLFGLVFYAAAGIADGAYHLRGPLPSGSHTNIVANLAVAFCAGLFWPIDIVARPLLLSR